MAFSSIKYSFAFVVVLVSFFNGILSLLKVVSRAVPTPYIDEIFHIPQAQQYCQYHFDKWDQKITTLPGLYLVSLAIIKPLEKTLELELCSVYGLRFVNVIGTVFNFFLIHAIQQKIWFKREPIGAYVEAWSSLNIAAFPPLFFFTFLYYTDIWSTAFVLLMYLLHLSDYPLLSAIAGAGAVLMRQTNIIWVGMIVVLSAKSALVGDSRIYSSMKKEWSSIIVALKRPPFFNIVHRTAPHLIVCILFLAFLIVNGGVVVGDRSAHRPVFHPMQNLYFFDLAAIFAIPHILFEFNFIRLNLRKKFQLLCTFWICCAVLSEYNLLEHPYLLADNRHLAFYIWKRTYGNRFIRRLLTPTYVISTLSICCLLKRQHFVLIISIVMCIIANLTPQYLFEVRYFILPYLMLRLHFYPRKAAILLETVYFSAINLFTFYIFLNKQFYWKNYPRDIQRIIW